MIDVSKLSDDEVEELLHLMELDEEYKKYNRILNFNPYPYQQKFFNAGSNYKRRFLCAANRIGKTFSAAVEMNYHLTQDYPDWWKGHRFEEPILAWGIGITGDSTQKVIQKELFGTENARFETLIGTGAIPKSKIVDVTRDGPRILMAKIQGKHGVSTLEFRSTQAGEAVLMGSTVHYIWLDEEDPWRSEQIYAQCVTRTATTNGLVTITATPEQGVTALVHKFMEDNTGYLYYQNATWNDAPHLTTDQKKELLASFPVWQHDMRSKGIPLMGEGLVYPVNEEDIKIDPIEIPAHWRRVCAVDIGIGESSTAVTWVAFDADTDTIYVYDTYHQAGATPADIGPQIKRRGQWIPCIMSHDSNNTEKGSGKTVAQYYREEGVNAQVEAFFNPIGADGKKNYFVEPGIMEITRRMKDGRFKVFSSCIRFWEEFRRYHRKDGKIVKTFDDQMDSCRYAAMSVTHRGKSLTEYETDQGYHVPYETVY